MNKDQMEKNELKKKKTTMTTKHFPNDIIVEILSKLPAKSLSRFKRVCKYWFNLIRDIDFVKMHLNNVQSTNNPLVLMNLIKFQSTNDHPFVCKSTSNVNHHRFSILELHSLKNSMKNDVLGGVETNFPCSWGIRILGSCNGLLCIGISTSRREMVIIWNPCTDEYKKVYEAEDTSLSRVNTRYGFGYDCNTDDYKLIRHTRDGDYVVTEVDVYTLRTSSWRRLPESIDTFFILWSRGLFINGNLYWMARTIDMIVAFDLAKEEYRRIGMPPTKESYRVKVRELEGCLCVINITDRKMESVEVWVMKRDPDDMKERCCWDKLYTITAPPDHTFCSLKPLRFCENGEIAMVMNKRKLILYNPEHNQIKFLPYKGCTMSKVEPYTESIVSINSGTYMGQERAREIENFAYKLRRKTG